MADLITFGISVFAGFFAVMNPIGDIPVFLSLVPQASVQEKKKISKKAAIVAFFIGLSFFLFGKLMFHFFGITLPAFRITGGILLFYIGFQMLQSKDSDVGKLKKVKIDENIAITPLAIPIITGPGTIVTGMNFITNASLEKHILIIIIFAVMCYINYLAFVLSDKLVKKIGNNSIDVIGKIMGLIIAIIGTTMIIEGIKTSFNLS